MHLAAEGSLVSWTRAVLVEYWGQSLRVVGSKGEWDMRNWRQVVKTTGFQELCYTGEQRNGKCVETGEGHGIKGVSI